MTEVQTSTGLVRATFYLRREDVLLLEELRLAAIRRGQKADKSALVREALALLQQQKEER